MDTSYFKVEDMNVSNAKFSVPESWAEDNSQAEQADLNSIIGSGCKCVCITKIDVSPINDFLALPCCYLPPMNSGTLNFAFETFISSTLK